MTYLISEYLRSRVLGNWQRVDSTWKNRDALKEKTGFDVSAALANLKAEQEEDKAPATAVPERRVKEEVKPAGRRTSGSNYKVVETKEETVE